MRWRIWFSGLDLMDMRTTWRLELGSKRESKYRLLPTTFVREHLRGELRGHQVDRSPLSEAEVTANGKAIEALQNTYPYSLAG
jgi:hypothetical protein